MITISCARRRKRGDSGTHPPELALRTTAPNMSMKMSAMGKLKTKIYSFDSALRMRSASLPVHRRKKSAHTKYARIASGYIMPKSTRLPVLNMRIVPLTEMSMPSLLKWPPLRSEYLSQEKSFLDMAVVRCLQERALAAGGEIRKWYAYRAACERVVEVDGSVMCVQPLSAILDTVVLA
jgi:hypothetical protein